MQCKRFIFSRGLPKTGQVTQARLGDDGTHEAGWWLKRLDADNRTRYIIKTIAGDDIVFDRATGLMWARDGDAQGCNYANAIAWAGGIDFANDLDFCGFGDWRIPNAKEAQSIIDHSLSEPVFPEPPFENVSSTGLWTSTTAAHQTLNAQYISGSTGGTYHSVKTAELVVRVVRLGI